MRQRPRARREAGMGDWEREPVSEEEGDGMTDDVSDRPYLSGPHGKFRAPA
jgi:hypothetical protein